jgi:multimeric flavodoxin WrbA
MKLLGLSAGRELANSEILLREALGAARETGVEVSLMRLHDLYIKPCTGCVKCTESLMQGGPGDCTIRGDDFKFFDEQLMECDGLIISAPVFILTPPGILKVLNDRLGPSHDAAWREEARKIHEAKGKGKGPDPRSFKKRVAGFISVGGATTPHWASLALPLMNLFTFPSHIQVVDQMQMLGATAFMNVVLEPEPHVERARRLGRHVAEAMLLPAEEVRWMGDEEGTCPVCHSNLLTVTSRNPVECPICGIAGTLMLEGDRIKVVFSEEEQARSRVTMAGKLEHWVEVRESLGMFFSRPDIEEIGARVGAYAAQDIPVLAPEREAVEA